MRRPDERQLPPPLALVFHPGDSARSAPTMAAMRETSYRWRPFRRAERPFVVFAATTQQEAVRLYRAQNLIWVWLGLVAILSAVTYFARPSLGPVVTTHAEVLDVGRMMLFCIGGGLISVGVWTIRRAFEVMGHVLFTTGALLNVLAVLTLPGTRGALVVETVTLAGLAFTSAYRAYFIVRWISADGRE